MRIYENKYTGERIEIHCNLANASSPIGYRYSERGPCEGDVDPTPYQVADARHDAYQILRLVVEWATKPR